MNDLLAESHLRVDNDNMKKCLRDFNHGSSQSSIETKSSFESEHAEHAAVLLSSMKNYQNSSQLYLDNSIPSIRKEFFTRLAAQTFKICAPKERDSLSHRCCEQPRKCLRSLESLYLKELDMRTRSSTKGSRKAKKAKGSNESEETPFNFINFLQLQSSSSSEIITSLMPIPHEVYFDQPYSELSEEIIPRRQGTMEDICSSYNTNIQPATMKEMIVNVGKLMIEEILLMEFKLPKPRRVNKGTVEQKHNRYKNTVTVRRQKRRSFDQRNVEFSFGHSSATWFHSTV